MDQEDQSKINEPTSGDEIGDVLDEDTENPGLVFFILGITFLPLGISLGLTNPAFFSFFVIGISFFVIGFTQMQTSQGSKDENAETDKE